MPGGNALLIGVGGSGRHCQTRLASFIAFYKCFSIEITKQQLHCSVIKQLMLVDWCWSIDVDSGHCEQRTRAVVVSRVATRWPPQLCSWQSFFLLLQDHPSQLRYKHNAFLEDLKKLYELTGVKNQKLTFLFSEAWTGDWIWTKHPVPVRPQSSIHEGFIGVQS